MGVDVWTKQEEWKLRLFDLPQREPPTGDHGVKGLGVGLFLDAHAVRACYVVAGSETALHFITADGEAVHSLPLPAAPTALAVGRFTAEAAAAGAGQVLVAGEDGWLYLVSDFQLARLQFLGLTVTHILAVDLNDLDGSGEPGAGAPHAAFLAGHFDNVLCLDEAGAPVRELETGGWVHALSAAPDPPTLVAGCGTRVLGFRIG